MTFLRPRNPRTTRPCLHQDAQLWAPALILREGLGGKAKASFGCPHDEQSIEPKIQLRCQPGCEQLLSSVSSFSTYKESLVLNKHVVTSVVSTYRNTLLHPRRRLLRSITTSHDFHDLLRPFTTQSFVLSLVPSFSMLFHRLLPCSPLRLLIGYYTDGPLDSVDLHLYP